MNDKGRYRAARAAKNTSQTILMDVILWPPATLLSNPCPVFGQAQWLQVDRTTAEAASVRKQPPSGKLNTPKNFTLPGSQAEHKVAKKAFTGRLPTEHHELVFRVR